MLQLQCMLLYYKSYNSHYKGLQFLMLVTKLKDHIQIVKKY